MQWVRRRVRSRSRPRGADWIRSPVFWMLAGTFAMMSLSFMGLLPHFVPMLGDAGH